MTKSDFVELEFSVNGKSVRQTLEFRPYQSIMLYVRSVILKTKPEVQEHLSYGIPFYSIKKKPMLYINVLKHTDFVDVAFVNGIKFKDDFPELKDYNTRKQVRSIQLKNIIF